MSEPATWRVKRRLPWLAGLLSFFIPGLGQLYNGQGKRALWFFCASLGLVIATTIVFRKVDAPLIFLPLLLSVLFAGFIVSLLAIIDAVRHARRVVTVPLKGYQRFWVYPCVSLAVLAVLYGDDSVAISGFQHIFDVSDVSMMPALLPGDYILTDQRYYRRHPLHRGDIAIETPSVGSEPVTAKRIVGLPGDRIQIVSGQILINDQPIGRQWLESAIHTDPSGEARNQSEFIENLDDKRQYHVFISDNAAPLENTEVFDVPPDQYFVLGDNRDSSLDSRMIERFGFVPRANITDRPVWILWSNDWSRIGRRVE